MGKFITDEHTGLTNWSEIIIWLPVMKNRSWNQSASTVSAIGAIFVRTVEPGVQTAVCGLNSGFALG